MTAYDAASVDLGHLNPYQVSYDPKQIRTEAILVTSENIGKLSLEFEVEVFFTSEDAPYFFATMARKLDKDPSGKMTGVKDVRVRVGDWIVPLRNEIHVYTDALFRSTFDVIGPPLPRLSREATAENRQVEVGV